MKDRDLKQRFSIRKLTIGAASVLIGLVFFGTNQTEVHAADTSTKAPVVEQKVQTDKADEQVQLPDTKVDAQSSNAKQTKVDIKATDSEQTKDTGHITTNAVPKKDVITEENKTKTSTDVANQAIVPAKGNTSQPDKINGAGGKNSTITGVPSNGSIAYNYSVSAKDNKNGQIQQVSSAEAGKDNHATINAKNAEDIEAHLSLKNISDQAQYIGDKNSTNNDNGVHFFINAWSGEKHTLVVDPDKQSNVVFIDNKSGQVINDDALPVYYLGSDQTWNSYQDTINKFGKDWIINVKQIAFAGEIPADTTARLNVPLVIDLKGTRTDLSNQITTNALNANSVYVYVHDSHPVWTKDEVQNDTIHLTTRNSNGSYNIVDDPALSDLVPKVGNILKINPNQQDDVELAYPDTFYSDETFDLEGSPLQEVVKQYGFSIDPNANDLNTLINHYSYSATPGLIIHEADGKGNAIPDSNKPYFYVEVHKIISTKDQTFQAGSSEAANWDYVQGITGLHNVEFPKANNTGAIFENVPVAPENAKLVSIKDAQGNIVQGINANTPAGKYLVTVAYKLNDSNQPDMLITKTFTVTVTTKVDEPETPTTPTTPTNPVVPDNPTTPTTPTTPAQPSEPQNAPVHSTDTPTAPTTNDDNKQTVVPKGQAVPTKEHKTTKREKTVAPKAQKPEKIENHTKVAEPTTLASTKSVVSNVTNKTVVNAETIGQKKSLPQTGEKQNGLAAFGLGLAALISSVGLAFLGKKKKVNR